MVIFSAICPNLKKIGFLEIVPYHFDICHSPQNLRWFSSVSQKNEIVPLLKTMSKKRHGRAWSQYFSTNPASANATWLVNGDPNWHHLYHSFASSFLQSCPHRIRNVGEFSIKSFTNYSKSLITLLGKVVLFQLLILIFIKS